MINATDTKNDYGYTDKKFNNMHDLEFIQLPDLEKTLKKVYGLKVYSYIANRLGGKVYCLCVHADKNGCITADALNLIVDTVKTYGLEYQYQQFIDKDPYAEPGFIITEEY